MINYSEYINKDKVKENFDIAKRINQNSICKNIFYKYMFKSIENDKIQTIFYYQNNNKLLKYQNFVKENEFNELFKDFIKYKRISKEDLEIEFINDSRILFKLGNDSARGYRYHFAVVDTYIEKDMADNVIYPKGILFEMAKREGLLKDNYNIEYIEM
jgi:hypothetical protein